MPTKPWYTSLTVWAALVSVAASVLSLFHVHLDEQLRADLADWSSPPPPWPAAPPPSTAASAPPGGSSRPPRPAATRTTTSPSPPPPSTRTGE
ncbi:MAG TPA: hypothetical protein VFB66_00075 [Tepidisphaeraceae bacterium]|nr:hypothetical protein [Tepidisphaeraceae bacterium]